MPDTHCLMKRDSPVMVLVVVLLMLAPVTAWARGYTVLVAPPNGADDTTNLQSALDTCVAHGKGCTVQLAAGTYLTTPTDQGGTNPSL